MNLLSHAIRCGAAQRLLVGLLQKDLLSTPLRSKSAGGRYVPVLLFVWFWFVS